MPNTSTTSTDSVAADSVGLDDLVHEIERLRVVENELARLSGLKTELRGTIKVEVGRDGNRGGADRLLS